VALWVVGRGQLLDGSVLGVRSRTGDPGPIPRDWLMNRSSEAFFPDDGQAADRVLADSTCAAPCGVRWQHSVRVYVRGRDAEITRTLAASAQAVDTDREIVNERALGSNSAARALWRQEGRPYSSDSIPSRGPSRTLTSPSRANSRRQARRAASRWHRFSRA